MEAQARKILEAQTSARPARCSHPGSGGYGLVLLESMESQVEAPMATGSSDEKVSSLWSQLPSFDPTVDDLREYMQKVRFLHGVFPEKEKANLAPRLAMLCKGTALESGSSFGPGKTDAACMIQGCHTCWKPSPHGRKHRSYRPMTYELFEKALYKVLQRPDEAAHSYTLRMQAAFSELGKRPQSKRCKLLCSLDNHGCRTRTKRGRCQCLRANFPCRRLRRQ